MMQSTKSSSPAKKASMISKEALIGLFASAAEAYNSCIYFFIAPFLAPLLFPNTSAESALLFSYCLTIFAPLMAYPLGAIYYGQKGDRRGRIEACTGSSLGLAFSTGLMALIPFGDPTGDYAWVFFALCISLGHFFAGGEYYSSIIFSLEHAKDEKHGTFSGLSCLAAVSGLLLSSSLSAWAGSTQFGNFSWRWLFAFGFFGGLISYFLKYHCRETPAFKSIELQTSQFEPFRSFIKRRWHQVLGVAIVAGFFGSIYAFIFYFIANQSSTLQSTTHAVLGMVCYGVCLLGFGILSERFYASRIMALGGIGLIACSACILSHRDAESLLLAKYALIFFASMVIGPLHAWMLSQFEPAERCRGLVCGFGLGSALFGGSTTPICLYLYGKGFTFLEAGIYPLFLTALTVLIVLKSKKGLFSASLCSAHYNIAAAASSTSHTTLAAKDCNT